jgi:hypothetical protein
VRLLSNIQGRTIRVEGKVVRIGRLDADLFHFVDNPEEVIGALRECGTRVDLFTFLQRLPEGPAKYSYPMEWDNLAVLPVSTFDHWWNEQIGFKARNKAKQAEKKGVELREVPFNDSLVHGIWEIYNECPVRQGRPFRHYGKDIDTVGREAATYLDSAIFIGAFLGGKLIGFVKLVHDQTRTQANLMHIISMIQHRDKAPTNALIASSVRSCAQHSIPYLVYSNFSYGNKVRDSLSDFKQRNGFRRVDVPRYFIPLTLLGSIAFRLGLHKSISNHLPEPILGRLREMRSAWYNRKFHSITEAY